uniref:Uncharacterized protein n=2 Tax=Noccaea caerulescens TaxID=107243 RepID=A0A1J3IGK1_NOCCA
MLSKKRPVRLFPFIAGMLDGANHPTSPNPTTFRSLLNQFLSKQVNLPPDAPASVRGFLTLNVGFRKDEERGLEETDDPARPITVDGVANVAAIFLLFASFSQTEVLSFFKK